MVEYTTIHSNNLEDMEEKLAAAEILIFKWDTNKRSEMLFQSNPEEVSMYMNTVQNLQEVMEHLSDGSTKAPELIHAQRLMKMAMARLQNDFHKILLSTSEPINPVRLWCNISSEETVTGSNCSSGADRICEYYMVPLEAVADLRNIAQLMTKTGYTSECVRVFALPRKSVVEESLYNLGIEKVNSNDVKKTEWKLLDEKIKRWIFATKISIRIMFAREKKLCADVFEGLDMMRDACFAEIVKDCTKRIFTLAEAVAVTSRAPERIFRVLDLYQVLSDLMPDIEGIYSQESCRSVHDEAKGILVRLGEAARRILEDFEKAIEKEKSKVPIAGSNVHPLTRYVMNYLVFLSDYKEILLHIIVDHAPREVTKILFDNEPNDPSAPLRVCFRRILFRLVCKVERKCNLYKDASLSHLFLRNNLHYVVQKVNGSELKSILGEEWLRKHCKGSR